MSKQTATSLKKVSVHQAEKLAQMALELPPGMTLTSQDSSWEEYEELMKLLVDVPSLRVSYSDRELQIMSLSARHERYADLLKFMMATIRLIMRVKILGSGSATMRKRKKEKGNEPDASFYLLSASLLPNPLDIDFEKDPPPDIAVELDVHHASGGKLHIYAALGVPEVWHYDQKRLVIYQLKGEAYVEVKNSLALPFLTSAKLTEFLNRSQHEEQDDILNDFEKWLKSLKKRSKQSAED